MRRVVTAVRLVKALMLLVIQPTETTKPQTSLVWEDVIKMVPMTMSIIDEVAVPLSSILPASLCLMGTYVRMRAILMVLAMVSVLVVPSGSM